jgi:hypothetical protein
LFESLDDLQSLVANDDLLVLQIGVSNGDGDVTLY